MSLHSHSPSPSGSVPVFSARRRAHRPVSSPKTFHLEQAGRRAPTPIRQPGGACTVLPRTPSAPSSRVLHLWEERNGASPQVLSTRRIIGAGFLGATGPTSSPTPHTHTTASAEGSWVDKLPSPNHWKSRDCLLRFQKSLSLWESKSKLQTGSTDEGFQHDPQRLSKFVVRGSFVVKL